MDELSIYDEEKGIFKIVLSKSKVMQGRYFISKDGGNDLNTRNLDHFIADAIKGITDVGVKYPCVICLPPYSVMRQGENGNQEEEFYFDLFFMCTAGYTGQSKVKQANPSTNTSTHHAWYDWKDMKQCAKDFLHTTDKLIRKKRLLGSNIPMAAKFNIDLNAKIRRLSNFGVDKISGVRLSFTGSLNGENCDIQDYEFSDFDSLEFSDEAIHHLHKH